MWTNPFQVLILMGGISIKRVFIALFSIILILGIIDSLNDGVITFKFLKPVFRETSLTIEPASANEQAFIDLKTKVATQILDDSILLKKTTNLGDSSEYAFATITTSLKNINYKTVTNITIDILPSPKINDQIILYSRDVQYVEISPFSDSTTTISILIKTKSTNKNEIINILKNAEFQLSWGKEQKKVFKFQSIT